jgi:hypothetical protein
LNDEPAVAARRLELALVAERRVARFLYDGLRLCASPAEE